MSATQAQLKLARSLYDRGQLPESERELRALLSSDPADTSANLLLGILCVRTRRSVEAEFYLELVLEREPDNYDALYWLANCLNSRQEFTRAVEISNRAISIAPENPAAFGALGASLLATGQFDKAIEPYQRATALSPRSAPAWHNLGRCLSASYRVREALDAFKKALELDPQEPSYTLEIFRQLELLGGWDEAKHYLTSAIAQHPTSVPLMLSLAKTESKLINDQLAEKLYKRAIRMDPRNSIEYALWLQENGRFEDSIAHVLESLKLVPLQGLAYFLLAEAKAFDQPNGSLIQSATEVNKDPRLDSKNRMYLAYAVAKAFEAERNYEAAIMRFDRANSLAFQVFKKHSQSPDLEYGGSDDRLEVFMNQEFLDSHRELGVPDTTPVLIVGMIRSGTTLVDQILASHKDVGVAGEQEFWTHVARQATDEWLINSFDQSKLATFGEHYVAKLKSVAGDRRVITDKMPLNFEYLGLIHLALPKAKIIHVRRSAMDTGLSIYTTHLGVGPAFAYSQRNIVDQYSHYLRKMRHWRSVLPSRAILEVNYEDLVADPEPVIRGMIEFLGLPWDESCLRHEATETTIRTPSRWQARQPIYSSSVERWRNYEPWLGELLELRTFAHPPLPTSSH